MQSVGKLIDFIDKNHDTPQVKYSLIGGIILCLVTAIYCMPSYEEYCKEPQAQCKEKSK